MTPPLFTGRFFLMCGFTFTVFVSAFQLLPTAPFHILSLGGSEFAAGLFLGLLTYASATSAPITGALGDRIGRRRMLIVCSLCLSAFSIAYSLSASYRVLLCLVVAHGVFWSGLLTSSSAYALGIIPESRRAEGIGYWGLSSIAAVAVAPGLGLLLYQRGWSWVCGSSALLNITMAAIAWQLPSDESTLESDRGRFFSAGLLEWRVLVVSFTLFLAAFGYGGLTSFVALYAVDRGITPASLYFTLFAISILFTRPFSGTLADRVGPKKVLYPCLVLVVIGLGLLSLAPSRTGFIVSALVFGLGFGSVYPAFATYVIAHVPPSRRGAAFGGILAALDTGIGTGSIVMGAIIGRNGFSRAFGVAACVAALALPYFALVEGRVLVDCSSDS